MPEALDENAEFCGEENGVQWFVKQKDTVNRVHIFLVRGRRVIGSWVSGRYVFHLLASQPADKLEAWLRAREAGEPAGEIGALRPPKQP